MTGKFLSLAAAALALAAPAQANPRNCAPHEAVVAHLADGFGESRQSIGLASNNMVVEVFASPETGTWTITMTAPGGLTCMVAAGEAFQHLEEALPNTDEPA
ncbi:MAG: hypothetical protein HLUCCA08_01490 [Rhodobacteraceae bacterium HLUCCA08]|nr:MAG: hypothetical protein HLUCCA08_01490 [Rhodobacteraceae bacterium HLUCCA08]